MFTMINMFCAPIAQSADQSKHSATRLHQRNKDFEFWGKFDYFTHWRIQGAPPAAPPPKVQILSFWHKKFSKHSCLGSWHPSPLRGRRPLLEILDPPLFLASCIGENACLQIMRNYGNFQTELLKLMFYRYLSKRYDWISCQAAWGIKHFAGNCLDAFIGIPIILK